MRACRKAAEDRQTPAFRYYMMHKPAGSVCACRDDAMQTVLDLMTPEQRAGVFPIGRLDRFSEGLILLTDDGKLNRKLLDPECRKEKEYLVWAAGTADAGMEKAFAEGMELKGCSGKTRPAKFSLLQTCTVGTIPPPVFANKTDWAEAHKDDPAFCAGIILTEGKRHQIKRMLEAAGCTALKLVRTSFAGLRLDPELKPGQYRQLHPEEIAQLKNGSGAG